MRNDKDIKVKEAEEEEALTDASQRIKPTCFMFFFGS